MEREQMVAELAVHLRRRGWWLACAESCTGGGVAAALTELAGSSAWFECGYVTYSNRAKREMLGVSEQTLARHGAVSRETVLEMATGALLRSHAQLSVAVSGIAGPGGGTPEKPVGTVWFAWATRETSVADCRVFSGDRVQVRGAAVDAALQGLLEHAR